MKYDKWEENKETVIKEWEKIWQESKDRFAAFLFIVFEEEIPWCSRCGRPMLSRHLWKRIPLAERPTMVFTSRGARNLCHPCYQNKFNNGWRPAEDVPEPNSPEVVARLRRLVGFGPDKEES